MSLFVLDTDSLTLFQEGHPAVTAQVRAHHANELAISVVTVEEQLSGWYAQVRKARSPEKLAWAYRRLAGNVRFLSRLQILDFDERAIDRYDALRNTTPCAS
jgi:tRNA(fMet)-specific endonuclease VapC